MTMTRKTLRVLSSGNVIHSHKIPFDDCEHLFLGLFCLSTLSFYIITHWSCIATGSLWNCLRSLVRYHWATTSPIVNLSSELNYLLAHFPEIFLLTNGGRGRWWLDSWHAKPYWLVSRNVNPPFVPPGGKILEQVLQWWVHIYDLGHKHVGSK